MNMQQMLMQAQKMQRELKKKLEALGNEEFEVTKSGAVKVVVLGNKTIKSVSIDEEALNKDDKEMVEELIVMAINEALKTISEKEAAINEQVTGRAGGFGF